MFHPKTLYNPMFDLEENFKIEILHYNTESILNLARFSFLQTWFELEDDILPYDIFL